MIFNGLSIAIFNVLNECNLYKAITCMFKKKAYINVEMFGKVHKKIDIPFLATVDNYSLEK